MRPPDIQGKASAWKLALLKSRADWDRAWEGTCALYLLSCNWAHPFWSYYYISGIHLRNIPGVKPAHKMFPEASHEIMIYSLDPKITPDPDKLETGEERPHFLLPADLIHQVSGLTDEQFKYLVQDVVLTIVEGRGSPDVDFRSFWRRATDMLAMDLRQGRKRIQ